MEVLISVDVYMIFILVQKIKALLPNEKWKGSFCQFENRYSFPKVAVEPARVIERGRSPMMMSVPLDFSENLLRESSIFHRNSSLYHPRTPSANSEFEPETTRLKLVYQVKRKKKLQSTRDTLLSIPVGGSSIFSICINAYPFIREKRDIFQFKTNIV